MILPRFEVLVPRTVEEACSMLNDHVADGVRVLAGGTDLLVDLRKPIIPQHVPRCDGCPSHPEGSVLSTISCSGMDSEPLMPSGGSLRATLTGSKHNSPKFIVSLHKLKQLKKIERLSDGRLQVGALTTITDIERSEIVRKGWPALAEGADSLGSPLVRNRGTIGGNIANARPAADTLIPSVALNGLLTLQGTSGTRAVPVDSFITGPGKTVIAPDEILTEVIYPAPEPHSSSAYYKLANRKALEISTTGVALWLVLEEPNGPVKKLRVALGAVGPTPILTESAADMLVGKIPDEKLLIETARAAAEDARPIDDHRGSAWYRIQMVEQLTLRLLKRTLARIRGEG